MSNKSIWRSLDNAAKIFPPSSNKRDTKVFRLSCELFDDVDRDILQRALDFAVEDFPMFKANIKKGMFWYYLETCSIKPTAVKEIQTPCSAIYDANIKKLLFNVTYYNRRINLEVYHALTDGAGALEFFRCLVYHYLSIRYRDELKDKNIKMNYDASIIQKMDDSFKKYSNGEKKKYKKAKIKGYKIHGSKLPEYRLKVISGAMPASKVIETAHKYGVSVTEFLTAVFMIAINGDMTYRERKKDVVISVPVNLRKYFSSSSARNFFSVVNVKYNFLNDSDDLKSVSESIKKQFEEELTKENLQGRLNSLTAIENNIFIRIIPLFIKDFFLKIAHDYTARINTAAISNLGIIKMPEEFEKYINLFDIFVSTNKIQICMITYGDKMSVAFTSPFVSTDIQMRFFKALAAMGIDIDISANRVED